MAAPVVHWEINSNNAEELRKFYSKVFGWNVNANNPMNYGLVMPDANRGIGGGIGQNDPSQPAPPSIMFYMEVSDLDETLNQAIAMGGSIVMPPMEIPDMITMAMFKDPEGNTLGLVKSMPPSKPARKKPAPRKKSPKKKISKTKAEKSSKRKKR